MIDAPLVQKRCSPAEAADLLARYAPGITDDVATALIELAGTTPAALVALAGALSPEQTRGYAPLPTALPADHQLRRDLRARLDALPAPARDLADLAAAPPHVPLPVLLAAAATFPPATTSEPAGAADLAGAELAGVVTTDAAAVRFASPLIAATVYAEMPLHRRQAAHTALADALAPLAGAPGRDEVPETAEAAEVRASRLAALLHRAAACTGPDADLARRLVHAAGKALPGDAAVAWEQAARLAPAPADRAPRLVHAARAAWLAGRAHAAATILHATPLARQQTGPVQVRARALVAETRLAQGRPGARDLLLDVAADLTGSDPLAALHALALAGEAAGHPGERDRFRAVAARVIDDRALAGAARGGGHATPAEHVGGPAAALLTVAHVTGLTAVAASDEEEALRCFRRTLDIAEGVGEPTALLRAATAGILAGDGRRAAACAQRAAVIARARGTTVLVPQALELAALAGLACGDYAAGTEAALDGAAISRSAGSPRLESSHLAILAVLAALAGDRDTARVRLDGARGDQWRPLGDWALALLDLCDGQFPAATGRLAAVVAQTSGPGSALLRFAVVPHLLEAAPGDSDQYGPVAAAFDRWAGLTGQPAWLALRDRCRALRSGDPAAADGHFGAALRHDGEAGFPRARTELLYGRFLRRRRRHIEARDHLRRAAETFRLLDAGPWAAQSIRELRAAGERTGRPVHAAPLTAALTAQQERIAALVAGGATNREVARELRLSPRTVDHHLRNVFARLGVRSRTEMARVLDH
ncbi:MULTISPECIES: helix-turn-helix transcriptional regulator [Actinoplanes]|uniref:helix-turn-helix domain-containing protein n=1 Tax=Actinoplanes TaxID=1865 RepID=UPI000A726BB9|nr:MULTISPECIES: helix-turn-helix transcriptional regulator [Actinoplanes]GLY06307.1 helix-turn-helix transcriptional regulator [Actinoplanes sp. NBRC 101535]